MAQLTPKRPSAAGTTTTLAAASVGGDSFANTGTEAFRIKNASGGPVTVTFNSPNACNFGVVSDDHDLEVVVADATEVEFGPFSQARFNDGTGKVQVAYSGVTGVTVGVFGR